MTTSSKARILLVTLVSLVLGSFAFADELAVNMTTQSTQTVPSVAADEDRFVVVWESHEGDLGSEIRARVFGHDGSPLTGELAVNQSSVGQQYVPDVALRSDGSFVVAWQSGGASGDGSGYGIFARLFSPEGNPLGQERLLNEWTAGQQLNPRVAAGPGDGFVAVWRSNGSFRNDNDGSSIQIRRFDSTGEPLDSEEYQVNLTTSGNQTRPDIAIGSDGRALVVWESLLQDGDGTAIVGSWFGADGDPDTGEISINQTTALFQDQPSVAMLEPGEAIVTWTSEEQDGDLGSIVQRRISAAGSSGPEELVNTLIEGNQESSSVVGLVDGGWLVTWTSDGSYGSDDGYYSVQARRYSANGTPEGPEEQINETTPNNQWLSSAGAGGETRIIAWESGEQDGDGGGIFARIQRPPALFYDGFESGTTSRWSS